MQEAGLGGAEIQPLYPIAVDDPARGIRNLRYFTDEWYEVLRHTIREGRRLGLEVDLTLGSGWPYGGPFIPTSLSARRLAVLTRDVVGPRPFRWRLTPHLTGDDRLVAVVAAPVSKDQAPELARARVLSDQPRASRGGAREELGMIDWAVPEGEWRVFVLIDSPTGQQVKRPTLGMEGLVLDHFSLEAMEVFLRAAGDRVMDAVGDAGLPLGLLRQPRGVRRRLDRRPPEGVPRAARLRPRPLPAGPRAGVRTRHAPRPLRLSPHPVRPHPRPLLPPARRVEREARNEGAHPGPWRVRRCDAGLRSRQHPRGREHLPRRPLHGEPASSTPRILGRPPLREAAGLGRDLHLAPDASLHDHPGADEGGHRLDVPRRPQPPRQPRLLVFPSRGR